jgi:hypothetical protein
MWPTWELTQRQGGILVDCIQSVDNRRAEGALGQSWLTVPEAPTDNATIRRIAG